MSDSQGIRLRYAGFVAFASNLLGVLAGLVFSMFTVRRLTPEEFGSWQLIGKLLPFFVIFGAPVNILITRFVSRGIKATKTGLLLISAISLLSFVLWFPITWAMSSFGNLGITMALFSLASIQIFPIYFTDSLVAVVTAHKPQLVGYSFAISEVTKIAFAYFLIVQARLGLTGAIVCTTITHVTRFVSLLFMSRQYIEGEVTREQTHRFLRLYWLPFYNVLRGVIAGLDVIVVTMIVGSTVPAGLYSSAMLVGVIIGYALTLATGLYPSLLRGGGPEDVEESMRLMFMFLVPMGVGAMVIPDAILNVLRPEYAQAGATLVAVALSTVVSGFSNIADNVLLGLDRADTDKELSFGEIVKSNLFRVPLVHYLNSVSYIVILAAVVSYLVPWTESSTLSLAWAIVSLVVGLPFVGIRFRMALKAMRFRVPMSNLVKYTFCSALMALAVTFMPRGALSKDVTTAAFQMLAPVFIGGCAYFGSLYVIDRHFRRTLGSIIHFSRAFLKI